MTAANVPLVIQEALERTGARPQVVTDNGSQFTAADFKALVRRFALAHIRIRTYHPESNGVIERYHCSTREALAAGELRNLGQARALIGAWVTHDNEHRLHAALGSLHPAEDYRGNPTARQADRQRKLALGRADRRQRNQERRQVAA
ncbi:MAG: integrase core domain-containing protein [Gemmatimonadaceae bacterium]